MAKKDDVFETTQIFDSLQWYKDDPSKRKRFSVQLLNNNGCLITIQKWNPGNGSNWVTDGTFWLRQSDMMLLSTVIDLTVGDIDAGEFGKERFFEGNKSDISFPIKKSNDTIYCGVKIQSKKGHSSTILLGTRVVEGISEGYIKLKEFRDALKNTIQRISTSYDVHYKKYFEALKSDKKSDYSKDKNNKKSNYSKKSKKGNKGDGFDASKDEDFPFG